MPKIFQKVSPENVNEALNIIRTRDGCSLTLSLSYKKLKKQDIENICKTLILNATWTSLDLSGCAIDDVGAIELAKSPNLTLLNLGNNDITNVGAIELAKSSNLATLNLSDNCISNYGAVELAKSLSLTTLDLSDNFISNIGAIELAKSSSLTTLDLSDNLIDVAGAVALTKNTTLTKLISSDNEFEQSYQDRLFQTILGNRNNCFNAYFFTLMVKQDFYILFVDHINSYLVPKSVHQNLTAFTKLLFLNEHQSRLQQKLLECELPYNKIRR